MIGSPQPTAGSAAHRGSRRGLLLPLAVSLAIAAAGAAPAAPSATREAGLLDSSLKRIADLSRRQVRPAARRLAEDLPAAAKRLGALREPARTTQQEAEVAFDELSQMSFPATVDPHYAAALVAAGRAFVAASGQDPLTRTAIDPGYTGLESELAASEARLAAAAAAAAKLSARVGRLSLALDRAKRRGDHLARLAQGASAPARRR